MELVRVMDKEGDIIHPSRKTAQDAQNIDLPGLHDPAEHRSVFIVSDIDAYIGKAEPRLPAFVFFLRCPFPVRKMEIHLIDPGLPSELGLIDLYNDSKDIPLIFSILAKTALLSQRCASFSLSTSLFFGDFAYRKVHRWKGLQTFTSMQKDSFSSLATIPSDISGKTMRESVVKLT